MRVFLRPGVLLGIALVSLLLAVTSIGLVAWIAADPQRWFPDAFAARGEGGTSWSARPTRPNRPTRAGGAGRRGRHLLTSIRRR